MTIVELSQITKISSSTLYKWNFYDITNYRYKLLKFLEVQNKDVLYSFFNSISNDNKVKLTLKKTSELTKIPLITLSRWNSLDKRSPKNLLCQFLRCQEPAYLIKKF